MANIIKTPTGLIQVDELSHVLTQEQYDALPEQERNIGTYYIIDGDNITEDVLGTMYTLIGIIGDTDISYIHDGTLTDIAANLYKDKAEKSDVDQLIIEVDRLTDLVGAGSSGDDIKIIGSTDISTISDGTLTGGIKYLNDTKANKEDLDGLLGNMGDLSSEILNKADVSDLQIVLAMAEQNETDIQNLSNSKANQSDIDDLSRRISSNATNITTILRTKADVTDVTNLSTKVDTNVVNISSLTANKANQAEVDMIAQDVAKLKTQVGTGSGSGSGGNYDALIGSTDIADIADGTITGGIRNLADSKANKSDMETALALKADASDLLSINSRLTDIDNDIYTAQFDIDNLKKNKADLEYVNTQVADLTDLIEGSSVALLGSSDISKIADGTITGAIVDFNNNKADKLEVTALDTKINTNISNIAGLEETKANKVDLEKVETDLTNKVNQVDFDELKVLVNNTADMASNKVSYDDFARVEKIVADHTTDISELEANMVTKDTVAELEGKIGNFATKYELTAAIDGVNLTLEQINTRIGDSDVSEIGTTISHAVLNLNDTKADKTDLVETNTLLATVEAQANTNKESIASLSTKIDEVEESIGATYNIGDTDISDIDDGTITGAIRKTYDIKADKTDLEPINKSIADITAELETKLDSANLTELETRVTNLDKSVTDGFTTANSRIDVVEDGLELKVDKTDFDALSAKHDSDIESLANTITDNNSGIDEIKEALLNKVDAGVYDLKVAALEADIKTNADAIADIDLSIVTTTESIQANTDSIININKELALKATKEEVEAISTGISSTIEQVATNTSTIEELDGKIATNATNITSINTLIGDTSAFEPTDTIISIINDLDTVKASAEEVQVIREDVGKNTSAIDILEEKILEIQGGIDLSIIGDTDISTISDGTLTGAIVLLNDTKAEKKDITSAVETINNSISSNTTEINALKSSVVTKAEQSDLDSLEETVASNTQNIGAVTSSIVTLSSEIGTVKNKLGNVDITGVGESITDAISKLDQTKLDSADIDSIQKAIDLNTENIATNTGDISTLKTSKADKTDLENLSKTVDSNTTAIETNASNITSLEETKLDKSELIDVTDSIQANTTAIADNTKSIETNAADIGILKSDKADKTDLYNTNKDIEALTSRVSTNETNISTNTVNITSLEETKLDKTELVSVTEDIIELDSRLTTAESNITSNDEDIAILQNTKLDKSELVDVTADIASLESKVDINTTAIIDLEDTKAEKSDLVITNENIETLDSRVSANETNIATNTGDISTLKTSKADKSELITINESITSNANAITANTELINGLDETKADKSELNIVSASVTTLTNRVSANETNIESINADITSLEETKLDKTAVKDFTDSIAANAEAIKTNADNIANNTTLITGLSESKADKSELATVKNNVTVNTNAITDINSSLVSINADITSLEETKLDKSELKDTSDAIAKNAEDIALNKTAIANNTTLITGLSDSKADKTTVSELDTRVTTNTYNITANTSAITSLEETKLDKSELKDTSDAIAKNAEDIAANTAAILLKADKTALEATDKNVSDLSTRLSTAETDIETNASDILLLQQNKLDKSEMKDVTDNITANTAAIAKNAEDIVLNTSSITSLNETKADKSELSTLTNRVSANETNIDANTTAISNKADKSELDALVIKVSANETNIDANTTALSNKADKSELDKTNLNVTNLTGRISTAETDINNIESYIASLGDAVDLSIIGDTDISTIGDGTLTGGIARLNSLKADRTEIEGVDSKVGALTTRVTAVEEQATTNAGDIIILKGRVSTTESEISSLQEFVDSLGSSIDLSIIGDTDISTIGDGTLTGGIANLYLSKASQTDLDDTNANVTNLTGRVETNETNITTNANEIDSVKGRVSTVEGSLASINTSIDGKADIDHDHVVADITDFPKSMPASDVYEWAKAETKPTYTAAEVGADPSGSSNTALSAAKSYTDTEIAALVNGAPETMDTLKELGDLITESSDITEAISEAIFKKADKTTVDALTLRVETNETDIASLEETKADKSVISNIEKTVSDLNTTVTGFDSRLSTAETNITKKADITTVNALTTRVTTAETNITNLQTNKADKSEITDMTTDIANLEKSVATNTTDIGTLKTGKADKSEITTLNTAIENLDKKITESTADITTHTSNTDIHVPTLETTNTARYLGNDGKWRTITKAYIGLGNVDNTADADKIVKIAKGLPYGTATPVGTSTTNHTVTMDGVDSYYEGLAVIIKFSTLATASSTININGLGAKSIYYAAGTTGNYFTPSAMYEFVYNGTAFYAIHSYNSNSSIAVYANANSEYPLMASRLSVSELPTSTTSNKASAGAVSSLVTMNPSTGIITAPTFRGTLEGNATSASKLQTARTITLSGGVTGSVSFDGSANVTITTSVASHTHNYLPLSGGTLTGELNFTGTGANKIRLARIETVPAVILHITNDYFYILLTNAENSYTASHNTLRPFIINTTTGSVTMSNGVTINNGLTVNGDITGTLAGNAATATKLQTARTITLSGDISGSVSFDGSGNVTMTTELVGGSLSGYLPLTGGTLTGNISYTMYDYTSTPLKIYGGNSSGHNISIGAGGGTIVGGGDSATNIQTLLTGTLNNLYLTSDSTIFFYVNCATISNRRGAILSSNLEFRPNSNNAGYIGTSSYYWNSAYITTIYGTLSGNAATATQLKTARTITLSGGVTGSASFDGSTNITITTTMGSHTHSEYLPLTGGTMTGNISYNMYDSTRIPVKVWGGNSDGIGISVGDGSTVIVGSGESAKAFESLVSATTDDLYLVSDNTIYFYTNCNTIGNRVSVILNEARAFYPSANNTGSLGASSYYWNTAYITTVYGTLSGNATSATKLQTARTISLTGAVTGSGSFDGSGNLSIATTIGSHTHSEYLPLTGGTMTGPITLNGLVAKPLISTTTDLNTISDGMYTTYTDANNNSYINNRPCDSAIFIMSFTVYDNSSQARKAQLAINTTEGTIYTRQFRDGSTGIGEWRTTLNSVNYNTFVPSLTGNNATGTWKISITGNAATTTKLATARTISLTGAVTGSGSFDGSGNLSITTTIGSHTHSEYLPIAGGTMTGLLTANDGISIPTVGSTRISGMTQTQTITFTGNSTSAYHPMIKYVQNSGNVVNIGNLNNSFGFVCYKADRTENGHDGWAYLDSSNGIFYSDKGFSGPLIGNATTATKLQTARTIFGASFDGTANIAGQGLFYGTYSESEAYRNCALQLRECDLVSNGQTDARYAPMIGFHWSNRNGMTLLMNSSSELAYMNGSATSYGNIRANVFYGALSGNASTSTKLATARTISLTGAITGSASFDGSTNITITTTMGSHTHSEYLPLTGGTLSGLLTANAGISIPTAGSNWVSGMTQTKLLTFTNNSTAYYPMIKYVQNSGNVVNIGNINNQFGLACYKADRTENGKDGWAYLDSTDGIFYSDNGFSGSLIGNASTATKLKTARTITLSGGVTGSVSFDGSANVTITTSVASHTHSYLPLTGGTLTGNISYTMYDSTQNPLHVYGGDTGGQGISIGGLATTIVGGGESAKAFESLVSATTDDLYLTSDGDIYIYTNCNTIGNRAGIIINSNRNFYPTTNNAGTIGLSNYHWEQAYINNIYGELNGNASTATKLATARTITLTGGVSGSATFDGSANITITTTASSHTHDQYVLKEGDTMTGELKIQKASTAIRIIHAANNPATLLYSNSGYFYIMFTATDSPVSGSFSSLRPLYINKTSGLVTMSNGLISNNTITANGAVNHANSTWNQYGTSVKIGDRTDAGHLGIHGVNGNTGIRFYKYGSTNQSGAASDSSLLEWDGTDLATSTSFKVPSLKITDNASITYDATYKCLNFNFA